MMTFADNAFSTLACQLHAAGVGTRKVTPFVFHQVNNVIGFPRPCVTVHKTNEKNHWRCATRMWFGFFAAVLQPLDGIERASDN